MSTPFAADARTALARAAMRHATGFVATVAPWLAVSSDRRMSRLTLVAVAIVLGLGLATTGWLGIEAVNLVVHRLERSEEP